MWEEIAILVSYKTDWEKGRAVVLEEVEAATCDFRDQSAGALVEMARRYLVARSEVEPLVFVKLTATGLSSPPASCSRYACRQVKSIISENVLKGFSRENVTIASATSEIVGFPPL